MKYHKPTTHCAAKDYDCDWCQKEIDSGDDYMKIKVAHKGRYELLRFHEDCHSEYDDAIYDLGLGDKDDKDPVVVKADHGEYETRKQCLHEAGLI